MLTAAFGKLTKKIRRQAIVEFTISSDMFVECLLYRPSLILVASFYFEKGTSKSKSNT
jgi:hypothetical protein